MFILLFIGVAAIQVPGISLIVDLILITDTISNYQNQLGLDDVSLTRLAKSQNLLLDDIHKKFNSGWMGTMIKNGMKNYVMETIQETLTENTMGKVIKFIPVVGVPAAMLRTAMTTVHVLHNSLDNMLVVAHSIIDLTK